MILHADITKHEWTQSTLVASGLYIAECSCGWYQVGPDPRGVNASVLNHMSFTL